MVLKFNYRHEITMNREIKFRGKRLANAEWCYGSLVKCGNKNHIIGFDEVDLDGHHIRYYSDRPVFTKQETIGQFTGLYDKNGKEIYEGDILMCIGQREDNKGRKYLRKVSFKNGSFCMSVLEYNIDSYLYKHIVNGKLNWEVIGNIYDNKELLEGTE